MTESSPAESCRAVLEQLGESDLVSPIEGLRLTTTEAIDSLLARRGQIAAEDLPGEVFNHLDSLIAIALPLGDHGGEAGIRAVIAAVRRVSFAAGDTREPSAASALAIGLHHLAWALLASSLAAERFGMIPALAGIASPTRYEGATFPIFQWADLRHADVFERGADETYSSFQSWFLASPVRSELESISSNREAECSAAEAELIAALCFARAEPDRTYSHIIGAGGEAERRLRGHLAMPEGSAALAAALGVPLAEIKTTLNDAYSRIVGPDRFPARGSLIQDKGSGG